jgi:hypothetical protein
MVRTGDFSAISAAELEGERISMQISGARARRGMSWPISFRRASSQRHRYSFRATGITNFLENEGTLEAAQRIAGHADSRTTKLYDRRGQKVLLEDMERIRY